VAAVYGITAAHVESLQPHMFDWRGIYRIADGAGRSWVLRLVRKTGSAPWLTQPATLLQWLAHQRYPAPTVALTVECHALRPGLSVRKLPRRARGRAGGRYISAQAAGALRRDRGDRAHRWPLSREMMANT